MTLTQAQVIRGETGFTTFDAAFRDVVGTYHSLECGASLIRLLLVRKADG